MKRSPRGCPEEGAEARGAERVGARRDCQGFSFHAEPTGPYYITGAQTCEKHHAGANPDDVRESRVKIIRFGAHESSKKKKKGYKPNQVLLLQREWRKREATPSGLCRAPVS